jgi:hypothetical protein
VTTLEALALVSIAGCAHGPWHEWDVRPAQTGCYQVHVDKGRAEQDLPPGFRGLVPNQVALTAKRESHEDRCDAGWRLATLGMESNRARIALTYGAWWPMEEGGIEVRLGDGFSGVWLRLRAVTNGFEGAAQTYQDVGDVSYPAHVRFERTQCLQQPTVVERRPY